MYNEPCPKCQGEKFPFDVHCDNCHEIGIPVHQGNKKAITDILDTFNYQYKGTIEKSKYADDKYILVITVPRQDANTLKLLINEVNKNTRTKL